MEGKINNLARLTPLKSGELRAPKTPWPFATPSSIPMAIEPLPFPAYFGIAVMWSKWKCTMVKWFSAKWKFPTFTTQRLVHKKVVDPDPNTTDFEDQFPGSSGQNMADPSSFAWSTKQPPSRIRSNHCPCCACFSPLAAVFLRSQCSKMAL